MSYASTEVTEYSAKQVFLYKLDGPDFQLLFTNAQTSITATISSTSYTFTRPRGGISHTEPSESQDPARTGTTLTVGMMNTLFRKHREYPPHGDTTLVIYRLNEVGGTPYQIWSGTVFSPVVEGIEAHFECLTDQELMMRAEGLQDTFQNLCNWFLYQHPCPVNKANWRVSLTVVSIDTENFTITVSGASDKIADWFTAGYVEAANGDKRSVLDDTFSTPNHTLTLQQNFPSSTLRVGDVLDGYAGCDRAFTTGRDKFGAETGNGVGCGTNHTQTNVPLHEIGRLQ